MSKIHKMICDAKGCDSKKNLGVVEYSMLEYIYQPWQELKFKNEHKEIITKHACCIDCAIKILNEENK